MARIRVGSVGVLFIAVLIAGCGGESAPTTQSGSDATVTSGDPGTTTSAPSTVSSVDSTGPTVPAGFPVPVCGITDGPCEGGVVYASYPTEVTVIYPEAEYDSVVDYYRAVSDANAGTEFELFPSGIEWQLSNIQIRVSPVDTENTPQFPPGTQLFIRLLQ